MWDKVILGNSVQTAKISKTGFAKIGHTAVSKPQWVGFSSTKTDCDKSESWEKKFSISLLRDVKHFYKLDIKYFTLHSYESP